MLQSICFSYDTFTVPNTMNVRASLRANEGYGLRWVWVSTLNGLNSNVRFSERKLADNIVRQTPARNMTVNLRGNYCYVLINFIANLSF